jgi:hypothetical protein
MARTSQQLLVKFLSDLYSIELQAIAQLVSAPDLAGDPGLAADFRTHHAETEQQAQKIRSRLEELGGSPSVIKDAVMKIGGKGFLLFRRSRTVPASWPRLLTRLSILRLRATNCCEELRDVLKTPRQRSSAGIFSSKSGPWPNAWRRS